MLQVRPQEIKTILVRRFLMDLRIRMSMKILDLQEWDINLKIRFLDLIPKIQIGNVLDLILDLELMLKNKR